MGRKHQNGGVVGAQRIYYDGGSMTGVHDLQSVYDSFSGSPTNREGFNRGQGYSTALYNFTTQTFTAGNTTGKIGPSAATLQSLYQSEVWYASYFSTTGGIQIWTAPETRTYEIELRGASGGGNTSGSYNPTDPGQGALVITRVTLSYGIQYNIVVGQTPGGSASKNGSAGGGGSWIYTGSIGGSGLIAVAGGGGGWGHGRSSTTGGNGLGGNNANDSRRVSALSTVNGKVGNGTGATNGVGNGGGLSTTGSFGGAAGGAGWLSDGTDRSGQGTGGHSIGPNAWEGGDSFDTSALDGGFGGGGMSNGNGEGGGGGGGYTGGPAGNDWSGNQWGNAGGGGSYWTGSLQSATKGDDGGSGGHLRSQATNGYVKITAV